MDKKTLRAHYRKKTQDEQAAQLWTDGEIDLYIREAECEACVSCDLIHDKSSALTVITPTVGMAFYAPSALFYNITDVKLNGRRLVRITRDKAQALDYTPLGAPQAYYIDLDGSIVFDRPIDASVTSLSFEGFRYPVEMATDDDLCEVPEMWQIKMLEWAFKLGKEKEDPQTERPADAAKHLANFLAFFAPTKNVDQIRRQGQGAHRVVRYGGL